MFGHVFWPYTIIALTVFGIVVLVLAFSLIRYRAGRGHEASAKSKHSVLEAVYALVLVGIASFLAVYVASANAAERRPLGRPQVSVTITGFQWCWSFTYHHTPVTVSGTCKNASQIPVLVVPTHEIIHFSLISADVVHEWWLPYARWKEEAFPGHYNTFDLRFTKTGEFNGRCDEYCGLYHDRMDFKLKAVTPAAFTSWLTAQTRRAASRP